MQSSLVINSSAIIGIVVLHNISKLHYQVVEGYLVIHQIPSKIISQYWWKFPHFSLNKSYRQQEII